MYKRQVVIGVTGSIAAYKMADVASALVKMNADVHVLMTENACNFINPITFETLTSNKCIVDTFDRNLDVYKRQDIDCIVKAERMKCSRNPELKNKFKGDVCK